MVIVEVRMNVKLFKHGYISKVYLLLVWINKLSNIVGNGLKTIDMNWMPYLESWKWFLYIWHENSLCEFMVFWMNFVVIWN